MNKSYIKTIQKKKLKTIQDASELYSIDNYYLQLENRDNKSTDFFINRFGEQNIFLLEYEFFPNIINPVYIKLSSFNDTEDNSHTINIVFILNKCNLLSIQRNQLLQSIKKMIVDEEGLLTFVNHNRIPKDIKGFFFIECCFNEFQDDDIIYSPNQTIKSLVLHPTLFKQHNLT